MFFFLFLSTSFFSLVFFLFLVRKNGIKVIEAPTDFQVKQESELLQFPSSTGLALSEAAFHEYLGLIWGKLKGSL
jgi:hypothetical protein